MTQTPYDRLKHNIWREERTVLNRIPSESPRRLKEIRPDGVKEYKVLYAEGFCNDRELEDLI